MTDTRDTMAAPRLLDVRDPRTGRIDMRLRAFGRQDVADAASAARAAQPAWQALGLDGRARALLALADALAAHAPAIQAALAVDTGRRRIAGLELDGAVASLRGWAAAAPGLLPPFAWTQGRSDPRIQHGPQFVPYALVGVISPWNFPLTLSMIDTIPALLAGAAVLVKPSEVTPRFVAPFAQAVAGVPALRDILAFAQGDGETGAALVDAVDAVCFTGSVATGRKVAVQAAGRLAPAFLELGGKDPLIVTESADLDRAVDAALRGAALATGQACQSIERIYVARPILDMFLDRLCAAAAATGFNAPEFADGTIGPIIFAPQAAVLERQLADAVARGARILTGGRIERHLGGLWMAPTVVRDVDHSMALMREETFGPILPVMPFDDIDTAVALANDSVYGLSAAVIAGSLDEAEAIGRRLDVGAVSLNDAALTSLFHEAEKQSFRQSGLGASRMGPAGFQRFLRRKALIANRGPVTPLDAWRDA